MSNIQTLADEITNDPLTLGYSGMTDQEVANSLNGITRPDPLVPRADILKYLIQNAKWKGLIESTTATAISAVRAFQDQDFGTIDLGDSANDGMLDQLVTETTLTSADKTAIMALQNNKKSRAQELGFDCVKLIYVQQARS